MDTYFPICLSCNWSKKVKNRARELCPECGEPLLYGCPICGADFEFPEQKYCGLKDCPAKAIPISEVIEKLKARELEPINSFALENAIPFLDEDTIKYFSEKLKKDELNIFDILKSDFEDDNDL